MNKTVTVIQITVEWHIKQIKIISKYMDIIPQAELQEAVWELHLANYATSQTISTKYSPKNPCYEASGAI